MNAFDNTLSGMMVKDYVIGWDMGGFNSFSDAMDTIDPENPGYGNWYLIDGEVYELIEQKGKPVFDFIKED